jgi:homoserine dehydrogenase
MRKIKTALLGFGNVGRELARVISRKADDIARCTGYAPTLTFIATSRGYAKLDEDWRDKAIEYASRYESGDRGFLRPLEDLWRIIDETLPEVAFIAIPPSYDTGEPNLSIYRGLIDRGVSFITADKTGLALRYSEIVSSANKKGIYIGYRATVMAGTPAIDAIRGIRGRDILTIRGILNATSNYILSLVEKGLGYREAIERAVEEKLAEPDPRIDIEGLDAAAKLAILANEAGLNVSLNEVRRKPLAEIPEDSVRRAHREGNAVKYIAHADMLKRELRVSPEIISASDFLATVSGNYNCLTIELEGDKITLIGPAGPAWRTANVMVTDLLYLASYNKD